MLLAAVEADRARRLTHTCNQALALDVLALHVCAYYLVLIELELKRPQTLARL